MRVVEWNGQKVSLECVSNMSTNYDANRFSEDTEYMIANAAVLGNSTGLVEVDGDDMSSALAAVHGRKYNNARTAIPFTREFVAKHYGEMDQVLREMQAKMSGSCAEIQKMMSPEQVQEGREMAMRSQAIRDARKELQNSGSAFNADAFSEANLSVRGRSKSKVYFQYNMSVSARRVNDTTGLDQKGQFKRKNISANDGRSVTAYVTTADEAGLKKVPLMTSEMRNKAEEIVYQFALVVNEEISKLGTDFTDEAAFTALKTIKEKMPGNDRLSVEIPEYNEAELSKIQSWKEEILENYRAI